jgi:GNAT superfamily N-acetyltransferase
MTVEIARAQTDEDFADVERLIRAYLEWLPFEVTFQDVDEELVSIRDRYSPPKGSALLAKIDGRAIGVVGLKDLGDGICEMKRLFVGEEGRGSGAGRLLAEGIVAEARRLGYKAMRLDTVPEIMPVANALYRRMGFVEIPAYVFNPFEEARFLELQL